MEKTVKNKIAYWVVKEEGLPVYAGSFTDCWNHLVRAYAGLTLGSLAKKRIKIARNN
jgi:hypothetical protein